MHLLILLLSLFNISSPYKVLVYNPTAGASHSNFLGKISDILIDAGHDVTMLNPVFVHGKKDLVGSEKVQKIIRIKQDPRVFKMFDESNIEERMRKSVWDARIDFSFSVSFAKNFTRAAGYTTENLFSQTDLIEQLREEKFDLGIAEPLFIGGFAFFNHIGVRATISADSMLYTPSMKSALGEPAATSYYPSVMSSNSDKMDITQRFFNFLGEFFGYYGNPLCGQEISSLPANYKGSRDWSELFASVAFNFVNSNQFIDYPSARLPKTVFVGGMQVNTKKEVELSEDWSELLDKRAQNVLISFGSQAHSSEMPEDFKSAFLQVFASMPDTTFIWKYEEANATLAHHLPNVHLTTWMPQNDLLADDRLSLFVTHGGLGSTMELAYQGKPAVIIPLLGDQPRNAHMLTRHGGAFQLDKTNLGNPDIIEKAIRTVMEDSSYKKKAVKLAKILEEQPFQPKDVVLRHCDFAVKHGALETLNSEGRHLNTLEYYSVDIAVLVLIVVIVLIAVLITVVMMSKRAVKLVMEKVRCTWKKSKMD